MSTLILNFGSICTLIGFTRSDVLELRGLSVTGSLCAIVYNSTAHPPPIRWTPILWSGTFAAVNGWKILQILHERQGSVHFTVEQEERYSNFFMPHGITPKQFEAIHKKATVLHVKKGELLVRQGDPVAAVYLVVSGVTRASVLGRFVTAASTTPTAQSERAGGASGAWIGEMGLLERVWQQQQQSINNNNTTSNAGTPQQTQQQQKSSMNKAIAPLQKSTDNPPTFATENKSVKQRPESKAGTPSDRKPATSVSDAHAENEPLTSQQQQQQQQAQTIMIKKQQQQHQEQRKLKASHQMYTIVAQEDCIVLRWSYDDMQSLMERSTDMRAALTRAMTAAIVAKVINFTVSRSSAKSTWATWLDDWKYNTLQMTGDEANAAATSSTESTATDATAPMYQEEEDVEENFPDYPLKRFQ